MITLFLLGATGTTLILGGVPVVLYGLMLETCRERREARTPARASHEAAPVTRRRLALVRAA